MFANFSRTTITSSSLISFAFVFFLVHADTAFPGELSLRSDSLSLRNIDVVANARGAMLLAGIALTFAALPFVELVFANHGLAIVELETRSAFAVLAFV